MKCGNCKGDHTTAGEVRECYRRTRERFGDAPEPDAGGYRMKAEQGTLHQLEVADPVETTNQPEAVAVVVAHEEVKVDPFDELVLSGEELIREHGVNVPRTPVPDEFKQMDEPPIDDPFAFKVGTQVPEWGTYTIVIPGREWDDIHGEHHKDDDTRRTFMFQVAEKGGLMGKVIIKYLNGPDNTRNYAGFANATADRRGVRVWKKYRDSYELIRHLKVLLKTEDSMLDGREAYALQSSRCSMCRKKLTVPASINRGLGPDCAKKAV